MNKTMLLRHVPAFALLTDAQIAVLASRVETKHYDRSQTIFHEGDIGSVLHIIVTGQVRIYRVSPSGQELAVAVFGDGDFFGELALLDGQPRAASAEAMVPTTTLTLDRNAFLHTINTSPPIAASILEVMALRLRQTNEYAGQLASLPVAQRVVRQLLDLASRRMQRSVGNISAVQVDLDLTQDELARLSGTTRETVNRVLSTLRDQGLVRIERARVCVLDLPQLRAVANAA